MRYSVVLSALSIKKAMDVYLLISFKSKTEEYVSFEQIRESLKIKKEALRRLTNRLARVGLIKSIKDKTSEDKRKRVYVAVDTFFADKISDIRNFFES